MDNWVPGLSALDVIVVDYLGRWPRLVWGRDVGVGGWAGIEVGTVLFTGGVIEQQMRKSAEGGGRLGRSLALPGVT
jgi:hypothetical protein